MRREKDLDKVDVHARAIKAAERANGNGRLQEVKHSPQASDTVEFLERYFLPHGRTLTMNQQAKGVFIPYPLLGIVMVLVMALGGGIIGLYSQLSAMNTTMILRDSDYQREQKQAWEKIEQLQVYIQNDREKLAQQASDINHLKDQRRQ